MMMIKGMLNSVRGITKFLSVFATITSLLCTLGLDLRSRRSLLWVRVQHLPQQFIQVGGVLCWYAILAQTTPIHHLNRVLEKPSHTLEG